MADLVTTETQTVPAPASPEAQAAELLRAPRVLLAVPPHPSDDALCAALALGELVRALGGSADTVCASGVPRYLSFLSGVDDVRAELQDTGTLQVVVTTTEKPLAEVSYDTVGDTARILLKSGGAPFDPSDIRIVQASPYAAAVVIGARSLEDFGEQIGRVADTFYSVPTLSLSNLPGSSPFGAVNVHDLRTASVSELALRVWRTTDTPLSVVGATCLLAGVLSATRSFRDARTNPQAFTAAAELTEGGAERQEIVRHLFKTRPLHVVHLWGRAAARLKVSADGRAAYALLSAQDLERSGASAADLPDVVRDLTEYLDGYQLVAVAVEQPGAGAAVAFATLDFARATANLEAAGEPLGRSGAYEFGLAQLPEGTGAEERILTAAAA